MNQQPSRRRVPSCPRSLRGTESKLALSGALHRGLLRQSSTHDSFDEFAPVPLPGSGEVEYSIELEREADGRWIAEVPELRGVLVYGADRAEAIARVQALALRLIAERLEHGEAAPEPLSVRFRAA